MTYYQSGQYLLYSCHFTSLTSSPYIILVRAPPLPVDTCSTISFLQQHWRTGIKSTVDTRLLTAQEKLWKTIAGCWRSLNFDPLQLCYSTVWWFFKQWLRLTKKNETDFGWMSWELSTGGALHPKALVNWTVKFAVKRLIHRAWNKKKKHMSNAYACSCRAN